MEDWNIQPGDTVYVNVDGEEHCIIHGIVRSMPCATGDSWIIESNWGVHYVQTFACLTRQKPN
jgi:hypothetical protein